MTRVEVAEKMRAAGRQQTNAGTIAKIEDGTRRVDVDDLVAIAEALGMTTEALLHEDLTGFRVAEVSAVATVGLGGHGALAAAGTVQDILARVEALEQRLGRAKETDVAHPITARSVTPDE